jgi:hypothetical protein
MFGVVPTTVSNYLLFARSCQAIGFSSRRAVLAGAGKDRDVGGAGPTKMRAAHSLTPGARSDAYAYTFVRVNGLWPNPEMGPTLMSPLRAD